MRFDILREPLLSQFVPDDEVLAQCRRSGQVLAEKAVEVSAR